MMRWFFTICLLVTGLHWSPGAHADEIAERRALADQAIATAEWNLGLLSYKDGHYKYAVHVFREAADKGFAPAQFNLGLMYNNGHGVVQDYKQAAFWFRKAADQGFASAQLNLGLMYTTGKGVVQNYLQAHKWYTLSATNSS